MNTNDPTQHEPSQPNAPAEHDAGANVLAAQTHEGHDAGSVGAAVDASDRKQRAAALDDDGPMPGNEAVRPQSDGDEEDGPAPGNEKFPSARAHTSNAGEAGTGKKRRRRRKGGASLDEAGGPRAHGPAGTGSAKGHGGTGRGAGPVQGGQAPSASGERAEHGRKRKPKPFRLDRGLAFSMGDVVFGKILEITDEAIFVDLSGKGTGIFDRREMLLPDDPEPGSVDEVDDDEETPVAEAQAGAGQDSTEPNVEPEVQASEVSAPPAATDATSDGASSEAAPHEPVASESQDATSADVDHVAQAAGPRTGHETRRETPPIPPIVLEEGAHFVGIVHNDGGRGGLVVLTRHPKRFRAAKAVVRGALENKTQVEALVTGVIKGGIEVDVDGLRGFVPASHMTLRMGADLTSFVGKRLSFDVSQYGARGRDLVLSRKSIVEGEAKAIREDVLTRINVGDTLDGIVRSVVQFGAFVEIAPGVEGLVPLTEMSHNRGDTPSSVFKLGETVQVKLTKVDDKGKIWLSRKATIADPWTEATQKECKSGTKHTGKVVRIQPFGAFVELEAGIDGLIHASDVMLTSNVATLKRFEDLGEILKVGQDLDVVVAHLDSSGKRIGLHPALEGEAAEEPTQRAQQYKMVKAKIIAIEARGLAVRVLGVTGRNARGFISGAGTGTPRGAELKKTFAVGQVIDGKIMEIDPKSGEVKLSIKAGTDDAEKAAYRQYREQVSKESKFTFGDLLAKKIAPSK